MSPLSWQQTTPVTRRVFGSDKAGIRGGGESDISEVGPRMAPSIARRQASRKKTLGLRWRTVNSKPLCI